MNSESTNLPYAVVPVVFFGASNAGKSTLIGYLLSSERDDIDVEKINSYVKLNSPADYRIDQYYSYVVDKDPEEWERKGQSKGLGTSKKMHISRIASINSSDLPTFNIDVILLDTPGSKRYYRDRFKGLTFGEIGIFVFEITRSACWLNCDATLDEMIDGLIPLNTWLKLPSKPKTIIVLSKGDNTDIPLDEVVGKWKAHAKIYCGNQVDNLPIVPTEVLVKDKQAKNIVKKANDQSYANTQGSLWEIIKDKVTCVAYNSIQEIEKSLPVFAVEKFFKHVQGVGFVLQGKVISGSFRVDNKIRIVPAIDEYRNPIDGGVIGTIKSIKQADGREISIAVRGDVVGIAFSKTNIKSFNARRGTLVIDKDARFLHGNCLELEIDAQDQETKLSLKLFEQCSVVWFGRVLPVQIIALGNNNVIVEMDTKSDALFVMPHKNNLAEMFTQDIVLLSPGKPIPIKAKILRIGDISEIDISEAHIEHINYEPGIRWVDRLKVKDRHMDVSSINVQPSSVHWKEEV